MTRAPLVFDTHFDGQHPKPIPLRLAYLVTSLTFDEFLGLFIGRKGLWGGGYIYVYAFDCDSYAEEHPVPAQYYERLQDRAQCRTEYPLLEAVAELPATHFVWSDELEIGLNTFCCEAHGPPEYDDEWAVKWDVDLQGADAVIQESVDRCNLALNSQKRPAVESRDHGGEPTEVTAGLKDSPIGAVSATNVIAAGSAPAVLPVTELSTRDLGKQATSARYESWGKARDEMRLRPPPKHHSRWTEELIGQEIAKLPIGKGYQPSYIRRWMKRK